jgi:uncharacterized OsmC-like protein
MWLGTAAKSCAAAIIGEPRWREKHKQESSMTITVTRDRAGRMRHSVAVRDHRFAVDELAAVGGEDSGPTPHDLYDAALAACKALTVVWYATASRFLSRTSK